MYTTKIKSNKLW